MKLLVTATGYFPGSELAVANVLKQALATLSLQTGIKFTLQEQAQNLEAVQEPTTGLKTAEVSVAAQSPDPREVAEEPVYQVIALGADVANLREMSVEELLHKSVETKGCDDLRTASALAHKMTRSPGNNVFIAVVVTMAREVVFYAQAEEGMFGIRFVTADGTVLGRKAWLNSAQEAHQAALLALLSGMDKAVPWEAVQVLDFRGSKQNPSCLAVVSRY